MAQESASQMDEAAGRQRVAGALGQPMTIGGILDGLLVVLASLRLTVLLLVLATLIVFVGTLAQVEKDVWQVTDEYFRTAIAWVDLQVFFPSHWFPRMPDVPGRFPMPGGWLIGSAIAVNLLAAHLVRFRVQARRGRLLLGCLLIAAGCTAAWLVIETGSDVGGTPDEFVVLDGHLFWALVKWGTFGAWGAAVAATLLRRTASAAERWLTAITLAGLTCLVAWIGMGGESAVPNASSLRILWQLLQGGVAALLLLAGCGILFRKRAGVVLLHAGLGLMMLGELLVGTRAVEGHMRLEEGQSSNYVEANRSYELAVANGSDTRESVVVVPASILQPDRTVSHADLPFDVHVLEYFANSKLVRGGIPANPARAGPARQWHAVEEPPVTGATDKVNLPSAYLELRAKGTSEPLGTYLVSLALSYQGVIETLTLDGRTYEVSLRYERTYKPYSIRLIDFRHDKYLGTEKAKDFSSLIHLTDPSHGIDREVRIWMNNPLRYAGETFYQSGHSSNPISGKEISILQVVSNPSWMIPYVACMLVATGMLAHFTIVLHRFLRRRSEGPVKPSAGPERNTSRRKSCAVSASVLLPAVVVAAAAALLFWRAIPPQVLATTEMNFFDFGKLPVAYEGRVKPMDTLARNSLSILCQRQTVQDAHGATQTAVRWLLDVITAAEDADDYRAFRIENPDVLQTLALERREGLRYSLAEFRGRLPELHRQVALTGSRRKEELTLYQKKLLELNHHLHLYQLLEQSFQIPQLDVPVESEQVFAALHRSRELGALQPPLAVPTQDAAENPWQTFLAAWATSRGKEMLGQAPDPAAAFLSKIFAAYDSQDAEAFNRETAHYLAFLRDREFEQYDAARLHWEALLNHAQPFFWSLILYLGAFLLAALAWLGWSRPLNRAALGLILLTLVVHTAALAARIYISGRPPVTNLYSSAVFIGWAGVILGVVLELVYRLGVGNVLAATSGFASLLVAFFLSRSGDTFVVLQAVLDTQFWLATHVVCITLGYATTFVAGFLGILYVIRGVATPSLSPRVAKELNRMTYGTICFAIFFSFVGTVLGGLWADDSWGRFWGWDPKENGALMIVLWNAILLHARWAGLVKERGLAVLAVGGNICTAWSWFGTNELGVGLHSYGFTEGVLPALGTFCIAQLLIMAVGMLPLRLWWSHRALYTHPGAASA